MPEPDRKSTQRLVEMFLSSDVAFWLLKFWASGCYRCQGSVCDGRHWISGGQVLIIHQYNLFMQNKFGQW